MNVRIYTFIAALGSCQLARGQDVLSRSEAAPTPAAGMPEMFSAGYLVQVLGSLLVVFICLFAVILLLKRVNRMGSSSGSALRVIASASLGQREKVVLLEAGQEQILLGVAPGNVRMLHVLPERVHLGGSAGASDSSDGNVNASTFADVLRAANPLGKQS
ncbi:MAG: flagellar biosynthetic protein FliO [Congregibacter sp.]